MKKNSLFLLIMFIGNFLNAQNLNIKETISYINKNLIENSEIKLDEDGFLTYLTLTKNYDLNMSTNPFDYGFDAFGNGKSSETYTKEINSKKTIIKIHISDIQNIQNWDPNNQFSKFFPRIAGKKYLEEWAVLIQCTNKVHHIKNGDCITINKDGQYRKEEYFTSGFKIRSKKGFKNTTEKIRNALLYLLDLARQKKYDIRETDEDPFASNNFNNHQFTIKSTKDNDEISLTNANGVYKIDISIDSTSRKFILDTGASDVLISKEYEKELIKKGILKKEHYISDGLYKIANGSVIKCRRLLIPKLKIGDFILENVNATVYDGKTLLLGKSVLDKFKSWSIDNLTKTLKLKK